MRDQYDFTDARRGAVLPVPAGKSRITIRIDDDILEWFRARVHAAGGGNYQTLINPALRDFIERPGEPLEELLRRVIRQELGDRAGATVKSSRAGKRDSQATKAVGDEVPTRR